MEYLEGQRQITDKVFESSYGNGQRVVVNYGEQPYSLPTGETVPARGYLLVQP
jgi:hypothetical protein